MTCGQAMTEWFMENENAVLEVPVSNWTLATGTRPGQRDVWFGDRCDDADADAGRQPLGDACGPFTDVGPRAGEIPAA